MYHIPKKAVCIILMILCMCILSSCGGKEFVFDDAITWNSTVDEIKAKYGAPAIEKQTNEPIFNVKENKVETYKATELLYENFNCCGYDGCYLIIYANEKQKNIGRLGIGFGEKITKKMISDVKESLMNIPASETHPSAVQTHLSAQ